MGQDPGKPGTGAVRGLRQIAEPRPGCLGDEPRERPQSAPPWVGDRQVAEEHEARSGPAQAFCDLPVLVRDLDAAQGFGDMRRAAVFGQRLRDPGERRDHAARRDDELLCDPVVEIEVDGVQDHHRPAAHRRLAQPVVGNGLVLARMGPDEERAVDPLEIGDGAAEPGEEGRLRVIAEIELPQAVIDVVGPQRPRELLEEIKLLEGRGGRGQGPESLRAMRLDAHA